MGNNTESNNKEKIIVFKEITIPLYKFKAKIRALLSTKYVIKNGILYPELQWTQAALECDKCLDELIECYKQDLKV